MNDYFNFNKNLETLVVKGLNTLDENNKVILL